MYPNIMLDLETLGKGNNSVVIAIGAVEFDHTGLGQTFYMNVDPQTCEDVGMKIDASTVMWWMKQSDAARKAFTDGMPITFALEKFSEYVKGCAGTNAEVWGNGAGFDNVILGNAYNAAKLSQPWPYWGDRCYRTLKNLYPHITTEKTGTAHNALDDAVSQAVHASKILMHIRGI